MSRKGPAKIRKIEPDAIYGSVTISKIINYAMMDGKKAVAEKQIYQALDLIKKQIKKLKKGDFTDSDIVKAKEYFTTALDDMLESPLEIIDCYYMMEVLGVDDFKTKREKMLMVTKEEILAVANKVSLHTVFCLKGVNNEEN